MPRATKVWMVPLGQGSVDEIAGELELSHEAILFTPRHEGSTVNIPFGSVLKVKRLRGSPVLMVTHGEGAARSETAFYFVRPPSLTHIVRSKEPQTQPLDPPLRLRPRPFGTSGRPSKRKSVRTNATYLTQQSTTKKAELEVWVEAIKEKVGRT